MNQRVVFSRQLYGDPTVGTPFEELGEIQGGAWGHLPDQAILSAPHGGIPFALLYFSLEDYLRAVDKLKPRAIVKVIRKRLDFWSKQALDEALDFLYCEERRSLALSAIGSSQAGSPEESWLDSRFEGSLALLAYIAGHGRYMEFKPVDLLLLLLRGETRLLEELRVAQDTARASNFSLLGQVAAKWSATAARRSAFLCDAVANMGCREYRNAPPFAEVERVLYIRPFDNDLAEALKVRDVPMLELPDGLVAVRPLRALEEIAASGAAAEIAYYHPGDFVEDVNSLTIDQLLRDLQSKQESGYGRSERPLLHHVIGLAVEQALLRRNVASALAPGMPFHLELRRQVAEDTSALKASMAQSALWIEDAPKSAAEAAALIRSAEQTITQDALFFAELSRRSRRASLHAQFEYIHRMRAG